MVVQHQIRIAPLAPQFQLRPPVCTRKLLLDAAVEHVQADTLAVGVSPRGILKRATEGKEELFSARRAHHCVALHIPEAAKPPMIGPEPDVHCIATAGSV